MTHNSPLRSTSSAIGIGVDDVRASGTLPDTNHSLHSIASDPGLAGQLVRQAIRFLKVDRDAAGRCLQDALALLGSDVQDRNASVPVTQQLSRTGGLARWQVKRALAYIEANLGSKIEVGELADRVTLSRSHFSRAFKKTLGIPPMAYVAMRRVERARVMLTSTGEELAAIALACGFADQSHLSRSFRRIVGMSPGSWRRANGEMVAAAGRAQLRGQRLSWMRPAREGAQPESPNGAKSPWVWG
jgi:AraC family transcriptional regulator